jgi:hypothetical protein
MSIRATKPFSNFISQNNPTYHEKYTLFSYFKLCFNCCTSKGLSSREEAYQLLQQDRHYPQLLDYDVYCGDVEQLKK